MILEPNKQALDQLNDILLEVLPNFIMGSLEKGVGKSGNTYLYNEYDPDYLEQLLDEESEGTIFNWDVSPKSVKKPVLPYIQSATTTYDGEINIVLDADSIENNFDVDEFIKYIKHIVKHEAVHLEQRDRMGHVRYASTKSGYAYMVDYLEKYGRAIQHVKKGARIYLSDPLEIMAHARDLADEMIALEPSWAGDPLTILRDPEGFLKYLPTWKRYRDAGFLRKDPIIRKLLRYTYEYYMLEKGK